MTQKPKLFVTPPENDEFPRTLQPTGWPRPLGYANGMTARGRVVVTGGVVGWDVMGNFPESFAAQARQTFSNILKILAEGGAGPEHVVRLTWYVTDLDEFFKHVDVRMEYFRAMPTSTTVEVRRLSHPDFMVEVEVLAMV